MNELIAIDCDPATELDLKRASESSTYRQVIDWHAIADQRLARLVEAEGDVAKFRERMDKVLQDQRDWIANGEIKLQSRLDAYGVRMAAKTSELENVIGDLRRQRDDMRVQLDKLSTRYDGVINSRSWKLTSPLRTLADKLHINHQGRRKILVRMSEVRGLRIFAKVILKPFPNIKSKIVKILVTGV